MSNNGNENETTMRAINETTMRALRELVDVAGALSRNQLIEKLTELVYGVAKTDLPAPYRLIETSLDEIRANRLVGVSSALRIGDRVSFGRANGEKTEGVVIKISLKSIGVETTEERGVGRVREAGKKWRVHPSLVTKI